MILNNIAHVKICIPLFIFFTLSFSKSFSQTPLSLSILGPKTAPIFVVNGKFGIEMYLRWCDVPDFWDSTEGQLLGYELMTKSDAATGNIKADGKILYAKGYFDKWTPEKGARASFICWDKVLGPYDQDHNIEILNNSLSVNLSIRQSGKNLIANGRLDTSAAYVDSNTRLFLFQAYPSFNIKNLIIDPIRWVVNASSVKLGGKIYTPVTGYLDISNKNLDWLPAESSYQWEPLTISYPDQDEDGLWDCEGGWKMQLDISVDKKNKISGSAIFSCVDKFGTPYENIEQSVSGNLKNGVITILAVGKAKATKKVSISLSFNQSNLQIVPNKNFVSAYGQTRRF